MTEIDVKELIKALEDCGDTVNLKIGSGRKEYDVSDIFSSPISNKLVIATEGYAKFKSKRRG